MIKSRVVRYLVWKIRIFIELNFSIENSRKVKQMISKITPLQLLLKKYFKESADIYLISFPKCGRTWLRLMIKRVLEQQFKLENVDDSTLNLDYLSTFHSDIPRICVDHEDKPYQKSPEQLATSKIQFKDAKVIFLVRDPRDVIVSMYFQKKERESSYKNDLKTYIRESVGSTDSLLKYYDIWSQNKQVPQDFLLVTYEKMQKNTQKELRRVLEFCGLQVRDEIISEAIEYASFNNMRKMEQEGKYKTEMLRPGDISNQESYKTRKGQVGGFREYLTQEDIEYINHKVQEILSPESLEFYGYKF